MPRDANGSRREGLDHEISVPCVSRRKPPEPPAGRAFSRVPSSAGTGTLDLFESGSFHPLNFNQGKCFVPIYRRPNTPVRASGKLPQPESVITWPAFVHRSSQSKVQFRRPRGMKPMPLKMMGRLFRRGPGSRLHSRFRLKLTDARRLARPALFTPVNMTDAGL